MKKRVGGIEEFEFDVLTEGSQMTITIAVGGWVKKDMDGRFTSWVCWSPKPQKIDLSPPSYHRMKAFSGELVRLMLMQLYLPLNLFIQKPGLLVKYLVLFKFEGLALLCLAEVKAKISL